MAFLLRLIIGIVVIAVGLVAIAGALGIAFTLLGLAIKVALIGLATYVVIRILSPSTAARIRERCSGALPGTHDSF